MSWLTPFTAMLALAVVIISVVLGLLWPLFPRQPADNTHRLGRLALRTSQFYHQQAATRLSELEAAAFERELAQDLLVATPVAGTPRALPTLVMLAVIFMIVAGSALGYTLSSRGAALQVERQRLADPLHDFSAAQQQEKQLALLQQKIRATPADSTLWAELGEYYLYRNAYAHAERAYQQALTLKGENAELYSALATVLYYQAAQTITPPMQALLDKALALDANEVTALMLLASDAFMRADYSRAISLWQQLLDMYNPRVNRAQLIEAINTAKLLQRSQQ